MKANMHLGQVRHAFARNLEGEENLSQKIRFLRWRGYLRANLSVFISVWNLVKPSMFTTQCSSSFSYMCSTVTCCSHAITSSCDPRGANSWGGSLGGLPPLEAPEGVTFHVTHHSPTPPHPPASDQVAIFSLFRPPGKS